MAAIALTIAPPGPASSSLFASAQNVAGKLAARPKLEGEGGTGIGTGTGKKKEKKKRFWEGIIRRKGRESREEGAEDLVCDDPEQLHTGFFQSVEVGFEDVGMVLRQKKKGKADREILDGSIRGVAKPGRMLAIMGPSGSGKSTLLHAIAGKVKEDKKISLRGKRYINDVPLTGDSPIPSAFIEQEVNFFPHMTVRETLDFQVELKMGAVLKTREERDALVKGLIDQLGLTKSANTIVGNAKVRGLSGGERKRLSIACEMISSPPLIFLDEPTSGLDSYQATQVVETLRKLADSGKTVVSVIHQPSQHTFQLFDDLLLISEGRLMYFGEVSKVRGHMTDLGYGCEAEVGTAEHVLDCVSRAVGADEEVERSSMERIERIAMAAAKQARELVVFDGNGKGDDGDDVEKKSSKKMKHIITAAHPGTNVFRQFKLLMGRSLQELLRGKAAIIIKVMQQVSMGIIYGGIYTLGDDQASIMDRFGLLSLIVIGATNMGMAGTIRSFPKEKAIVSSEMAASMYRTGPYFVAKAFSEIPFIGLYNAVFASIIYPLVRLQKGRFKNFLGVTSLHSIASQAFGLLVGSVSSSSDVALALFPPIIILNIIFDGKNISEENTPAVLKWVSRVGLIRWGFTGLALNEFEGLEFTSGGPFRGPTAKTGEDALSRFGLDGKSLGDVVGAQTKIIVGCWVMSFLGLALTRQRFEIMKNPSQ